MKMTMRFLSIAALVLVGLVMTGCSGDDNIIDEPQQPANTNNVVTVRTTVSMGGINVTRALNPATGVKTFAAGDKISVCYITTGNYFDRAESDALTAGDISTDGKTATFTVTLSNPKNGGGVYYAYPSAFFQEDFVTAQDGTLAKLQSTFDYAESPVGTMTVSGSDVTLPSLELANLFAVCALTIKYGDTDITGTITDLTVNDGTITYRVTRSAAPGPIYLAIRPTDNANITVTGTDGTDTYTKSLSAKTYAAGNIYNLGWRMTRTRDAVPLTMEALSTGTIVVTNPKDGMQYSKNGGAKTAVTSDAISVTTGDKVAFYGNGTSITAYGASSASSSTRIGGTAQVKAYGNIMSLVDETGFATATTLSSNYAFTSLFYQNTHLTDANGLLLPATTMSAYCYRNMFNGCNISKIPHISKTNINMPRSE